MLDKVCLKLMDSKCERDYKNTHRWARVGTGSDDKRVYTVWQCSQCGLCVLENLKFIIETKEKYPEIKETLEEKK